MIVPRAYAQSVDVGPGDIAAVSPPSTGEAFAWNIGMVLILVVLFYFLMIRPQQKRFKEHAAMLAALKKGDKVVTSGGLIGKIDKIKEADEEAIVDLGGGQKVSVVLSTLTRKETKKT